MAATLNTTKSKEDRVLDAVRALMLGQQIGAYKSVKERITGTQWKLVRFAEIITFCDEKIAELERQIKDIR